MDTCVKNSASSVLARSFAVCSRSLVSTSSGNSRTSTTSFSPTLMTLSLFLSGKKDSTVSKGITSPLFWNLMRNTTR